MTRRTWLPCIVALALFSSPLVCHAQLERIQRAVFGPRPAGVPAAGAAAAETPADTDPAPEEPEAEATPRPKVVLPPRYMMLRLQDGSTIAGELSVNDIKIATQFGDLTVPVEKIVSFTPGLESNAKAAEELKAKLQDLESDDYQTREQAHKALAAMGPKIAKHIAPYAASENAEVKRHVTEILKEFEATAEEREESDEEESVSTPHVWINEDTLVTTAFTVTGKISPATFEVASKYGPLTIALGDIVQASRPVDSRESVRRSLSVPGQNLVARSFKSSGIRVQAGDRVTITASGTITMTPWGNNASSGPDGMPNYGWYVPNQIPGGALVYKIGEKGQITKAGSKTSFTAKTSGTLQLAVGMMPEYSNEGYNFPGEYKVKVKVEPK
jgi:hypothetical protein